MRHATIIRSWKLLAVLRLSGDNTLERLARQFPDVHPRTIRRDLQALETAGVAIERVEGADTKTRWRVRRGAPCPICCRLPAETRRAS